MRWAFYVHSVPFTPAVVSGTASLGGSESACLGLARALVARGHQVHVYATQLDPACVGPDSAGVVWHPAETLPDAVHLTWDVFVSLRMPDALTAPVPARLRLLWNQDLLDPTQGAPIFSQLWQADGLVYVSQYHRHQWETVEPGMRELPYVYVTRNGYDPALVPDPATVTKAPTRIIHISRPERALDPILAMWPALRRQRPDAELHLCRYSSMYDAHGWGQVCAAYDARVAEMQAEHGGIVWLGELGKPALYRAIAEAAVMWYPGVASFAETSCIAAIEAQACGTPFVGSARGALPETVPSGLLLDGDALTDPAYHRASIAGVLEALDGCARQTRRYRDQQAAGRAHVTRYTYAALAAEWEQWVLATFETRSRTHARQQLHAALYEDDHAVARVIAEELGDTATVAFCDRVAAQEDQTAADYAERAGVDPIAEGDGDGRQQWMVEAFREDIEAGRCTHVLDLACGNGAVALLLARTYPTVRVTGVDYAAGNIAAARAAAERIGVADRVAFHAAPIYDPQTHTLAAGFTGWLQDGPAARFDGVILGEFLEHLLRPDVLLNGLAPAVAPGALVVCTMPHGPFTALLGRDVPVRRGHVHHYEQDDLDAIFGPLDAYAWEAMHAGWTGRGDPIGIWVVTYRHDPARRAGARDLAWRRRSLRPRPRVSVGLITRNAAADLDRCLASVWPIADEIVVGDGGSTDQTRTIAEAWGARVIDLLPVEAYAGGFSEARNHVLAACTGDWFFWIDADEVLTEPPPVSKYLRTGPFAGYSLAQTHVYVDQPPTVDKPIRLFRRTPDVQFYGCVHEQPQHGDENGEIIPALLIQDTRLAHTGYLTEPARKRKMLTRNLPLLMRDVERFPDRRLGRVLWVREFVNHAQLELETHGRLTEAARRYLSLAIGLFEEHFSNPADPLSVLARPFYESALKTVESGFEFAFTLAGRQGGLNGKAPAIKRWWVRGDQPEQLQRLVAHELATVMRALQPTVIDTRPVTPTAAAIDEGVPV